MIQGEDWFLEPEGPPYAWANAPAPQGPPSEQYAGTSLRLQILEIIGSILNSTGPELAEARLSMRHLVREHPWNPEVALLLHLRERRQYTAAPNAAAPSTATPYDGNLAAPPPSYVQAATLPPEPSAPDEPA